MRIPNPDATPVPWGEGSVEVYGGSYDPDDCVRCESCERILRGEMDDGLCAHCAEENPYCLYCDRRIFDNAVFEDGDSFHPRCHAAAKEEELT